MIAPRTKSIVVYSVTLLAALWMLALTLQVVADHNQPKPKPVRQGMSAAEVARRTFMAATTANPLDPTIVDSLKTHTSISGDFAVVTLKAKIGTGVGRENLTLRVRLNRTPWQVLDVQRVREWRAE